MKGLKKNMKGFIRRNRIAIEQSFETIYYYAREDD